MRIISGEKRGFKLKAPDGLDTRPTTDRIKESLFNILSPMLYGCNFLDLFSGSGGIGIEALSRGAEKAVFVDRAEDAVKVINYNLTKTAYNERAVVIRQNYGSALKRLAAMGLKFDIIFMDPPYYSDFIEIILDEIKNLGILNNKGIIVVEQAKDESEIMKPGFDVFRIKEYGRTTKMSFIRLLEEEPC